MNTPLAQSYDTVTPIRRVGRVVRGVLIGLLLVPAAAGLVAFVGNITAFAYQGY